MSLRTKILLTYATGITLLWVGLFWLRHAYPTAKPLPPSPGKTGDAIPLFPSP
jgi:hypothetical protein